MATLQREDSTCPLRTAVSSNRSSGGSSPTDGIRSRSGGSSPTDRVERESTCRPRANPSAENSWRYALCVSGVCLFLGFAIGATSDLALYSNKVERVDDEHFQLMEAIQYIVSLVGTAVGGWTADKIGRIRMILWMGIFFSGGSLLVGVFPSNILFILGRCCMQLSAGFGPMVATTYVSEISPIFSRGRLASFPQVSINLGTLLAYGFNYAIFKLHSNFGQPAMISLGAITLLLVTIGIRILPESPCWLLMQGNVRDAKLVLANTSTSQEEADRRLIDVMANLGIHVEPHRDFVQVDNPSVWRELLLPATRPVFHLMACAVGLQMLQQLSGFDTVSLFSPTIIKNAGVTSYTEKLLFAILFQAVKTIVSLFTLFLLERVSRTLLLLISISGMTVSLATLGTGLLMKVAAMCFTSLFFLAVFYSLGMGPVTSVYCSEVFPIRLRAQGYALALATNQLIGIALAATFITLCKAITLAGAVFSFMVVAMLGILFVCLVLPETQGKTQEEVRNMFGTIFQWRRSAGTGEVEMRAQ